MTPPTNAFFITDLKEKLNDSSARSIFVNAHPQKSQNKIDLLLLSQLYPSFKHNQFLLDLLDLKSFKVQLPIDYTNSMDRKFHRRLVNFLRKNEDYKNEFNLSPFGFGYPLLLLPDSKRKKINYVPILIWDFQITGHLMRSASINLKRKSNASVVVNPFLINHIKSIFGASFDMDPFRIENIKQEELLRLLNVILKIYNSDLIHADFFESSIKHLGEFPEKFIQNSTVKIIHNGVFGLYANSKEAIISDYISLENNTIPFHLKATNNFNTSFFSGTLLDHSQQRVIRAINEKENTLIHGPPGTGKSKTLTAVILYALSKGQSCLLVCEKKTAVEVIYSNLKALDLDEFCVNISDLKKDRARVVGQARSILDRQQKDGFSLFEQPNSYREIPFSSNASIAQKLASVDETIRLINNTKNKTNRKLIDGLSYADLVVKLKQDRFKSLSSQYNLNSNDFVFTEQELTSMDSFFDRLEDFQKHAINPYTSFYNDMDAAVFKTYSTAMFYTEFTRIYTTYFKELLRLNSEIEKLKEEANPFLLKYLNYVSDNDSPLGNLFKKVEIIKQKIFSSGFFGRELSHALQTVAPKKQLEVLIETLTKIEAIKGDFSSLVSYHKLSQSFGDKELKLAQIFFSNPKFKDDFLEWYFLKILKDYFVDNLDFNGFEKGYYDIENDVSSINSFVLSETKSRLEFRRQKAINTFTDQLQSLSLVQFFSKRSTSQRKKLSLAKIGQHPSKVFQHFFPLVMTNPTACSGLFPMERGYFDFVIFDESSQLRLEDTFPALLRGKQRIIAGDINQMPPSRFFSSQLQMNDAHIASEKPKDTPTQSLLEHAMDQNFSEHYLKIHYRSKHPDLIQFSNHAFYGSRLIPLPPEKQYKALEFIESNGDYIDQVNRKEAMDIVAYLKEEIPIENSVGIATFSVSQRDEILDLIEWMTKTDLSFYQKMIAFRAQGFFVKNLENIQGEERDIIIISSTYGVGKDGTFKQLFGPLNTKDRGHKLLNVMITRAIYKTVVFCSIPKSNLNQYQALVADEGNRGKAIFYAYLNYVKAVSDGNTSQKEIILEVVRRNQLKIVGTTKYHTPDLEAFGLFLKNQIAQFTGSKIAVENNVALGGFIYEIALITEVGPRVLIDLNGKAISGHFEDYLYDMNRCKVALQSGYFYYRLWLSNFFNNMDAELRKIDQLINN